MPVKKNAHAMIKKEQGIPPATISYEESARKFLAKAQVIADETDFSNIRSNKSLWIENKVIEPLQYFVEQKAHQHTYTEDDLANVLDVVIRLCNIFGDKVRYQPTIYTYCRLLNVSTRAFYGWTVENDDRGTQARVVQDYFRSILTQGLMANDINPAAGAFVGKATLQMKESDTQQLNINVFNGDLSVEDIMQDYAKNLLTTKKNGDNL